MNDMYPENENRRFPRSVDAFRMLTRLAASLAYTSLFLGLFAEPTIADEMTAESLLKSYVSEVNNKDDGVERALSAFKNRKFEDAREHLDSAVKSDPRLPPSGLLLARMFYAANRPIEARAELEQVSKNHPADPGPSLLFGELALAGQRFSEAELAFNKAVELSREVVSNEYRKRDVIIRCRKGLAAVAEARQDWGKAADLLRSVVDDDPDSAANVTRLSRSLFKNGEQKEALKLLQQQWESNKDGFQRPEISAAILYQQDGDKVKAAELMKMAAKRDPENAATLRFVAQWALENGDFALAQSCADQAMAVSDSSPGSRLTAAIVARHREQYELARERLESVHLELPTNLAAVTELALVLGELDGMESRALQYAELILRLKPDLRTLQGRNSSIAVAWLLYRFGRRPQSEQILQQALPAGAISAESSYLAAMMLESNRPKAAKELLDAAIRSGTVFHKREHAKKLQKSLP